MKKISFLFALLCASVMSFAATQYCGETSPNTNFTFSLMNVSGNTYRVQLDAIGEDKFVSVYNNNCGVNQSAGAGINLGTASDWVITDDRAYIDFTTASESSVPTGFYGNYFCFNKKGGGLIEISNFNPTDVDWTATCTGGGGDKTASGLTINATEKTLDATNSETFQIVATTAEDYDGTITYASNKEGIATVSGSGLVTAVGRGTATITVTAPETDTFAASTKKLTVTVTGPINWEGIDWLANSTQYKVVVDPEIGSQFGGIKKDGDNLWVGFPGASFGTMSIESNGGSGAWKTFALSNFPAKENQFTVVCDGTTYTFYVYNEDGTPVSEYCGKRMSSGNTEAAFTWETYEGSVIITINEVLGGAANASHFRGDGISIGKIKVGDEDASTYFNLTCGGAQTITLSLKNSENAPEVGTKIYVTNQIIEYATSKDGNAWPTLSFEYTYGSVLSYIPTPTTMYLAASSSYCQEEGSITITPIVVDQAFKSIEADISYAISPADAGGVENHVYTPAKVGAAVITATAGVASKEISLYCVPGDNLALDKTVKAGYEPSNAGEVSSKVVDGNTGTLWVTWADQTAEKEWLYLDLAAKYDLFGVDIVWGDNISNNYILQVRNDAPAAADEADDTAWTTLATVTDAVNNSSKFTPLNGTGRYLRFHSLSRPDNCIRMAELRVFGTLWVDPNDTEKPVMTSAELVSKTWNSAVIAVAATDNHGVASYRVVNVDPAINETLAAIDGNITITGLTAATAYDFTITALDEALNESENSESVAFTTSNNIPSESAPVPTWPAAQVKSIYSDTYEFAPASLNSYNETWWDNPNMAEEDIDGNHYLHYDLYRNGMIGAEFGEISVATMEKVHIDIFASASGSVTFRLITKENPVINIPKTLNLEAEQWNSFDIDLADFGEGHDWSTLYQFAIEAYNAGGLVGEHISVDNIYLYRTTALQDEEAPTNVSASATASYFSVVLTVSAEDNSGAVNFTVKKGEDIVGTGAGTSGANVNITVNGLTPNTDYNFSVIASDENGNAADPVAVAAKTLVAPSPADAPTYAADNVLAIFTDIYTDLPFVIQNWYAGPAVVEGALTASSTALSIEPNNTENSCFGIAFASTDITDYNALEMDVYATVADAAFNLQVIGVGEAMPCNLVAGQWNHISLDIKGNTKTDCTQIGFYNCNNLKGTCFIQNVLFAKKIAASIDNTDAVVKAVKLIENGQLIIIKNGIRYNVAGQMVK